MNSGGGNGKSAGGNGGSAGGNGGSAGGNSGSTGGNSGSPGGNGDSNKSTGWAIFTALIANNFTTFIGVAAAVGSLGIYFTIPSYRYYNVRREVSNSLKKKFKFDEPLNYVERKQLKKDLMYNCLSSFDTILIEGVRGSGKSVAVASTFDKKENVLYLKYEGDSQEEVWKSLMTDMAPSSGLMKIPYYKQFKYFLAERKINKKEPPFIIIEIGEFTNSDTLRSILLRAKDLGDDLKLARFVVVVSAALASYTLSIGYQELRCKVFSFPILVTEEEARLYLTKIFSQILGPARSGDIGHLVDFALLNVELRLLALRMLGIEVDLRKCTTTEEIKAAISMYHTKTYRLYTNICQDVLKRLGVTNKSSPAFKLMEHLSNNEAVDYFDFQDDYEVDKALFNEVNHSLRPHPFVFKELSVQILSEEMAKALRALLLKMKE